MRIGGILQFTADGIVYSAKGEWEYSIMDSQAKGVAGADGVHGFTETPMVPYISGEITDRSDLDLKALVSMRDATIMLNLANGKIVALRNAWYAGEGKVGTAEGNIEAKFEGLKGQEIA